MRDGVFKTGPAGAFERIKPIDPEVHEIDSVEVEALTEGELEEVAGGVCSVSGCSNSKQ